MEQFLLCSVRKTWEKCLQTIEKQKWLPSSRNGNLELKHFERCKDYFAEMQLIASQFVSESRLLEVLGVKGLGDEMVGDKVPDKDRALGIKNVQSSLVIKTLINNLPLLHIKTPGISILIDVVCFLNDPDIITESMELTQRSDPPSPESNDTEVHEGHIPISQRKPGSGRPK